MLGLRVSGFSRLSNFGGPEISFPHYRYVEFYAFRVHEAASKNCLLMIAAKWIDFVGSYLDSLTTPLDDMDCPGRLSPDILCFSETSGEFICGTTRKTCQGTCCVPRAVVQLAAVARQLGSTIARVRW